MKRYILVFGLFIVSFSISIGQASLGTFCVDTPDVQNTGYCTLLDPNDAGHQECVDSATMQTCDGAG